MDKKVKNIISKDDFLRYRSGKMTVEERNAFERELQKDPFAEEAADGFSLLSSDEAEMGLKAISEKLKKRTHVESSAIYYRIAAAVAVLVTLSVIFFSRKQHTEVMLSKSDTEKTETTLVIAASEPIRDKTEKAEIRNVTGKGTPSSTTQQSDHQILKLSDNQRIAVASDIKEEEKEEVGIKGKEDAKAAPVEMDDRYSVLAEAEKKMERSAIAGVAAPMAAKSLSGPGYSGPEPLTGIDSFNVYISKNIRLPQPGSYGMEIVILSFMVKTDSTITDIKVIESPGQQYTREAKRLIKEGPLWKPAIRDGKPAEEEYRLSIQFR